MIILASASPRRLQLLEQVGIVPGQVIPADIDETPLSGEQPKPYALRMAEVKARLIAADHPNDVVLAADTVVAVGKRILPKVEDETTARECLELLSGKRHSVFTAVCVISKGKRQSEIVETLVCFKQLNAYEIGDYVVSGEWQGKAGGYAIQGRAGALIPKIEGSYSNVVGLPLVETCRMLAQA